MNEGISKEGELMSSSNDNGGALTGCEVWLVISKSSSRESCMRREVESRKGWVGWERNRINEVVKNVEDDEGGVQQGERDVRNDELALLHLPLSWTL